MSALASRLDAHLAQRGGVACCPLVARAGDRGQARSRIPIHPDGAAGDGREVAFHRVELTPPRRPKGLMCNSFPERRDAHRLTSTRAGSLPATGGIRPACALESSSRGCRTPERSPLPVRRRTCQAGWRARRRGARRRRSRSPTLHTAGRRRFNPSTDRCFGAPPPAPAAPDRCPPPSSGRRAAGPERSGGRRRACPGRG